MRSLADTSDIATLPVQSLQLMGNALIFGGDPPASIAWLRKAHRQHPGDVWISFDLAYHLSNSPSAAVPEVLQFYEAALGARPQSPALNRTVGHFLFRLNRLDEAIAAYRKAIQLDPKTPGSYGSLATVLQRKGDLDGAITVYRQAIDINPKDSARYLDLGGALQGKGEHDPAVAAYRKAVELDPKSVQTHAKLGHALREKGDLNGAIAAYQQAAQVEPQEPWWWLILAQAHLTSGDRKGHHKVCAEMLDRFGKTKDPKGAMRVLSTCLPVADALADMRQLLPLAELAATQKGNAQLLGAALYRAGKYEAAIAPLGQGEWPRAWDHLFLAMAHHRLGHKEEARDYLVWAISQIKKAGYPWPEAVESEQLRHEAEALLGAVGIDARGIDPDKAAIAGYCRAIKANPNSARAHNALARLLATSSSPKHRDPRQAIQHAQKAVELAPKDGNFWDTLAVAQSRAGDWAGAVLAYRQALALETFTPDHPATLNTLNALATAYQRSGNLPEAIRLFEQVRDKRLQTLGLDNPLTLVSMNNLGVAYLEAGKFDRAVPLLEETVRLRKAKFGADDSATRTVVANLGASYGQAGRLKEAIPLLEEVVAWARRQPALRQQEFGWVEGALAEAYERDQQFAKAEPFYRAALEAVRRQFGAADPRTAVALANLGSNLLEQKKYAEAEPLLRECLAAREKAMPDAWPTFNAKSMLGGCLLGQKKYAAAEPLLLQGYEGMKQREAKMPPAARPRLPEAIERLVRLYDEWGKKAEAAKWRKELEAVKKPEKKD
ncbi:MAG: tetratricopeptide repeat protein [Planctomycetes bacterium]|nr:tetratricopeptide repeat protein [Planctomycetota bacterium]